MFIVLVVLIATVVVLIIITIVVGDWPQLRDPSPRPPRGRHEGSELERACNLLRIRTSTLEGTLLRMFISTLN